MILRKPYGFLIKYFKFIHLILTGLYIYLAIKVNSILVYYNDFINGVVSKLDARDYITSYYMIAVILSIVFCLIIYALMSYKKKPRFLYIILIMFSIISAIMINYSYQGLNTIYISLLESKSLLLHRDLLRILIVFQYLAVIVVLVRGLGFDIKKFNFVEDLHDLGLDDSDEEEIELSLGDNQNVTRRVNRNVRELKYYYLENKTFILIILGIILVVGVGSFIFKEEVIDKVYKQNEVFITDNFQMLVSDSFITNKSFDNKKILNNNKSFVIVKMNLAVNGEKKEFNTANLILKINNNSYVSEERYAARFSDLGVAYRGEKLGGVGTYLFIYQVENDNLNKNMRLIYANDKEIDLNPIFLDDEVKFNEYKLGTNINLAETSLRFGNFKINSLDIKDEFSYPYQYEIGGEIRESEYNINSINNIIMNLKIESSYSNGEDSYLFLERYAKLKYIKDDILYTSKSFDNKTPGNCKDALYLGVDKDIINASSIWLEIVVRNKGYKYVLK